ncbi:hypothetical protein PUG81_27430 [Erwiniaceae bacterium L1_54_6]|nr:hypothetical protein [Erwiniaceae bacterium L1_54_6]
MDRESLQYQFPETLNQQKCLLGRPPEEVSVTVACARLLCDLFIVMLVMAGALWLLIRHLKKE